MRSSISVLIAALVCFVALIGWTQLPAAGEPASVPVLPFGVVTGTVGSVTPTGTPTGTAAATPSMTPATAPATPSGTPVRTGTAAGTMTASPGITATGSPVRTPTGGTPGTPSGTRTGTPGTARPTNTPGGFVIEDDGCQVVQADASAWHLIVLGLALAGLRRTRRR